MNEHVTADVLRELERIGIDFDTMSVPLIGTGLRASEIVDWLRAMPDDAGADELVRRLGDHARNALTDRPVHIRWTREPARPDHRTRRERWWPTQMLLDAGTDLLSEEWDPFTLRHAGVEREQIATYAFHFLACFLSPNGSIDPVTHAAGMIGSSERDHLALAMSPEPHRRYLATRLRELVDRHARPPTTAAERIEWLDRSHGPATTGESRSWIDTVDNIRMIEAMRAEHQTTEQEWNAHLTQIAGELIRREPGMAGPMPAGVEAFVRQHGPRS